MKLMIEIETNNKQSLVNELYSIYHQVKDELNDPICKDCETCKDMEKGCIVGGGMSQKGLESDWKLGRNLNEHKTICKSKQKKTGI